MDNLKFKFNSKSAFDPSYPDIDNNNFKEFDYTNFYENELDAIPPNTPLFRDKEVNQFIDTWALIMLVTRGLGYLGLCS